MAVILIGGPQALCHAQEITSFRFTGFDGYFSTSYDTDEFTTREPSFGGPASPRQRQSQSELRFEAFLMSHSYLTIPNFLPWTSAADRCFRWGAYRRMAW
ncbi:MAG: hypothetical protein IPP88_24405 [Betaproteobacteria bacterium]|nr:hypothetical protein [Betaproteobacteria bacterium]